MTEEERKYCKSPIILKLANKLNKSGGHYVSVNLKESKFGICKQCHKFNLIGRKDKICSGCYYQELEETTCLNWE